MARRPRILHVLRSARAEGTVKLTLDLLGTEGAEQLVLILEPRPDDLLGGLQARAMSVRIEDGLPEGAAKFRWLVQRVRAACAADRPDIVICWPNGFGAFVLLGAALAGVPGLITHAGNPPTPTTRGLLHTWFTTAAVWMLGGRMICCSQYVADRFAGANGGFAAILRVVYNCVPLSSVETAARAARAQRSDRNPRLIMVATLERHKDHATLLRAMPAVLRAEPRATLRLAGDGTLGDALRRLSGELGLDGAVRFLGSRRDVPALLGDSDVFVFSTTSQEGLGTVLIEALAAGLRVVASDVPACREALGGGRWGLLVPPGDASALAAAVVQAVRTPPPADPGALGEFLSRHAPARMLAGYVSAVA